ncbi:hypothetical protein B0H66DRAFT_484978 [Apodospora peruviana]|uniref:Uncharacterized protein n=1 Tax=Apodospora peruviana TaxID=516989 RepID=A0AAE0LYU7_9PEZI|nr:hypothetical protein B0H66DRAFT_484978 [Apodospora peruviana]
MSEVPQIQILDKKNYFTQALVSLPDALPLPPLKASSLRIRTVVLTISLNTVANATKSAVLSSWTVHPLPSSTPAPYNDASKYGRINSWGYGQVAESTFPGVSKDAYVYGYLPIGTLPFDITVETRPGVPGHIFATDTARQHLLATYNRYMVHPEPKLLADEIASRSPALAFETAFRIMHESAFVLNAWAYCPRPEHSVPLSGLDTSFSTKATDLTDAVVLVLAPGSKVALAFAWMLRNERHQGGANPRKIVGVASEHSVDFVKATGLYNETVLTSEENPVELLKSWGVAKDKNLVLIDFGGRGGAGVKWASALKPVYPKLGFAMIGVEVTENSTADAVKTAIGLGGVPFNFSQLRDEAIKRTGEAEYFEAVDRSLKDFMQNQIPGFEARWEEGMEAVMEGYKAFCTSSVGSNVGLVYKV